jgi:hypothetical protein
VLGATLGINLGGAVQELWERKDTMDKANGCLGGDAKVARGSIGTFFGSRSNQVTCGPPPLAGSPACAPSTHGGVMLS